MQNHSLGLMDIWPSPLHPRCPLLGAQLFDALEVGEGLLRDLRGLDEDGSLVIMAQSAVGEIMAAEKDVALVDDDQFGVCRPRWRIELDLDPVPAHVRCHAMVGFSGELLS